jgi:hypothetical protein
VVQVVMYLYYCLELAEVLDLLTKVVY